MSVLENCFEDPEIVKLLFTNRSFLILFLTFFNHIKLSKKVKRDLFWLKILSKIMHQNSNPSKIFLAQLELFCFDIFSIFSDFLAF